MFLAGDEAPGTNGESFQNQPAKHVSVADNGDVLFTALCCGKFTEGIFRTVRVASAIPFQGFESPGREGMPGGWETRWTNAGTGEARQYNSGGADAFEGNSTLRFHTGPGGGAVFV